MTILSENPKLEKEGIKLKVKLFTHNDLDGIGCAIVAKRTFGASNVDVVYNRYEDIDDNVEKFLFSPEYEDFDAVFITDISVSRELAKTIDNSFAGKIQLVDHHATAEWLNKYNWATVQVNEGLLPGLEDEREERLASGTSLFFRYLWDNRLTQDTEMIDIVEQIRRYDTWDWKNVYNDQTPKQLNDLFSLIGRYDFVDRFVGNPSVLFNSVERKILELEQKRIDLYIKSKRNSLFEIDIIGYNAGVVFAEQYISELGNVLCTENPQLDFVVIINPEGRISLRSSQDRVHLGEEIAPLFGGGGHEKAAGGKFDYELSKLFFETLLKRLAKQRRE